MLTLSKFFAAGYKIMQHYVIQLYNNMPHYIIRGDISPHIRRLIVVNDRFCGDNCPYFNWHIMLHNVALLCIICGDKLYVGDDVTKRAKNGKNYA